MIIKCPKCQRSFLAPDDLQENQALQCGFCFNIWLLEQEMKTIPEEIKPKKSSKKTTSMNKKEPIVFNDPITFNDFFKKVMQRLLLLVIIVIILIHSRTVLVDAWQPFAKVFEVIGFPVEVQSKHLEFQNMKLYPEGPSFILSGQIKNNGSYMSNIPTLRISPNLKIPLATKQLKGNEFFTFKIRLPYSIKTPVKVSF